MPAIRDNTRHDRLFALLHQQNRAGAVCDRLHPQALTAGDELRLQSRAAASFQPQRLNSGYLRAAGAGKQVFSVTENGARLAAKAGGHHKLFGTVRP